MTLITLQDLENSLKINQLLKTQGNPSAFNQPQDFNSVQNNLNFMLQNASVTKTNLLTNAMMQQIQQQSMYNKSQLILNCMQNNNNSIGTTTSCTSVKNSPTETGSQKNQINSGRYKTELCRQFIENGGCKYGDKCQFAHGMPDLKDVNRHPKYKTDYCKTFHSKGFCPYGPRCHFIHELNEKFDQNANGLAKKSGKVQDAEKLEADEPNLDKQLEALHSRLSANLFIAEDTNTERFNCNNSSTNSNLYTDTTGLSKKANSFNQIDELNSSFLSSSSPPISPMPQQRTRSGTSSTSSLISSTSSYDLNQYDRVFSPTPKSQQHLMKQSTYTLPISKNLIQIGRNLIHEKLTNPNQDQATLNQQIYNIERLNNLLNTNQLSFYQNGLDRQQGSW